MEMTTEQFHQALVLFSALSVGFGVLAVAWPWLARDRMGERIRAIEQGPRKTYHRERTGAVANDRRRSRLFAREPNWIFAEIVEKLGLGRLSNDSDVPRFLRMAGLRGRAPLVAYLASRLIAALAVPGAAFAYIGLVLKPDLSLPIIALIASAGAPVGFALPGIYVRNLISKRSDSLRRSWPDTLDLLLICVESGMSVEGAFRKVAEEMATQSKVMAEEMSLTTAELAYLTDRRQAYENLAKRTGLDSVKATVIGLIQSEKYGTSLGQTLRVLAKESRDFRMAAAEKKAASLPPKLTVPMILFFLPVLFAVIATPAVIQALAAS